MFISFSSPQSLLLQGLCGTHIFSPHRLLCEIYKVLESLKGWVNSTDRSRNKKHEVFEPSFDWKECNDEHLVEQKLNYIHENASKGESRLVENPADYEHSSAEFYILGKNGSVRITNTLNCRI